MQSQQSGTRSVSGRWKCDFTCSVPSGWCLKMCARAAAPEATHYLICTATSRRVCPRLGNTSSLGWFCPPDQLTRDSCPQSHSPPGGGGLHGGHAEVGSLTPPSPVWTLGKLFSLSVPQCSLGSCPSTVPPSGHSSELHQTLKVWPILATEKPSLRRRSLQAGCCHRLCRRQPTWEHLQPACSVCCLGG